MSMKYFIKVVVENMEDFKWVIEGIGVEVIEIMLIFESKEKLFRLKIKVFYKCDYCGKEIVGELIVYKYRNKVYFFCCLMCLREFKKMRENLEKVMVGEEKE